MRRLAPLLLVVPLLAACGGGPTDAAPTPPTDQSTPTPSSSAVAGSSGTTSPSPTTFTPRAVRAVPAPWHLPYAAGRQAVVSLGGGRALVAGGLIAGDASTDRVVRVDPGRGRVTAMPHLAVPVHDVAGGLAGATPLVVGGGNATEQDVVQALHGGRWTVVGHLPTTRSDLSVVQHGPTPWVVGGYDGSGTPTAVLALAPDGSAREVGSLVRGVRYAATATLGHTAYVFGGEVLGRELDTVQAVDLQTGRTRLVGRLPVPVGHAMAVSFGSRILVMGGRTSPDVQTDAMWWFDPRSATFHRAGRLPQPLSDAAVTTSGRRAWLLGGEDPTVTDGVLTISVR